VSLNSDQILDALKEIAALRGNEKLVKLGHYLNDSEFATIVLLALDPYRTYGINKIPGVKTHGTNVFDALTYGLLGELERRWLTGNKAREMVEFELQKLTPKSAELLKRILTKDLRAGFGRKSVNKLRKGFVPSFEVMLAEPYEPKRIKAFPVVAEVKEDGVRVIALVDVERWETQFVSREGHPFTAYEHFSHDLLEFAKAIGTKKLVLDGEMISGKFNKTVSDARKKKAKATDAVFKIFELFIDDEFDRDVIPMPLVSRRKRLLGYLRQHKPKNVQCIDTKIIKSFEELNAYVELLWSRRREGAIVKDPSAFYEKKRSFGWLKIKAEEDAEGIVVGVVAGTGKNADTFGSISVEIDGVVTDVAGFTDETHAEIWQMYLRGTLLGRMVEVKYQEKTPDGRLRHPRFVGFRDTEQFRGEKVV
jgi:DNA ligase-1